MRSFKQKYNQSGLVSLMVTMILMMVISLIVLGFAQMSRREQRQALDRQLSAQAFLAAEAGINDAREAIRVGLRTTGQVPDKTQCGPTNGNDPYASFNPVLDAANNVSYSCLLVNTRLQNIVQVIAADGNSVTIPIHPVGGRIDRLHLRWSAPNAPNLLDLTRCPASLPTGGVNSFPKAADWRCPYGVLRVDLVPTDSLNRDGLLTNQRAMFFYPTTARTVQPLGYNNAKGAIMPMACSTNGCTIDIAGMVNSTNGARDFSIRIKGIYVGGSLDISADNASGDPLLLKDAQALADATGRAEDVLRRMQVRIAITPPGNGGEYAIQSGSSICKRFGISPDRFRIPDDMPGQDTNNPLCNPVVIQPPCVPMARDIVLVLDFSLSMSARWETTNRINKLREVTTRLIINSALSPEGNHMALVEFNGGARVLQDLTHDTLALQAGLANGRQVYGTSTGLAMEAADQVFAMIPPARTGVGQTVVFISDGQPVPGSEGPRAITRANLMKARGVEIYSIGILRDGDNGVDTLSALATDPAHFTLAANEADIDRAIGEISTKFSCS